MKSRYFILYSFILIVFFSSKSFSQELERKDVPDKYKWNLSDLYPTEQAWLAEKDVISKKTNEVVNFKGRLGESGKTLYQALKIYFDLWKDYARFADYASRLSDEDLRNTHNQSLAQQASQVGTEISEKTAFISPDLLKISPDKMKSFFSEEKGLSGYKMFIGDIQRLRKHTLSEQEEKILASFGSVLGTESDVYNIFNNAEMPFAKVKLSDGNEITLSSSSYTRYRAVDNRADRAKIFESFFGNYGKYKNTIGTNLGGKVKADYVLAKDRNYKTALEASLDARNIPASVYENLIAQFHKSLPTLHRFLNLKKRMLGLDTLHYYDLYTPIVKEVKMDFTIPQGERVILDALKPMGKEYLATIQKAFDDRWIDFMPTAGKRSGAYSSGAAYDVHPYILNNWNDDYESVSTLAHELGHTMHSYFSNKTQTFANADYATFVAEIASTCNENLLNYYMVKHAKTDEEKLYLLGSYLELLRTTIFRQTMFAEFEWDIHQMAEKGEPLNGESISAVYYKLAKEYYGDDQGYCVVDPYIAYEWEYIPHFINYTYYVYQYSTSLIYSTAFAEKILTEGQPAVDKYYNILKGGGSDYPINLIKKAGIDPLSSEPFELTMKRMNDVMDQIEEILNREKKG